MIHTIEDLERAYDACKKVRKELAEIEPIDDFHREQIFIAAQKVDEIRNELKVKIDRIIKGRA